MRGIGIKSFALAILLMDLSQISGANTYPFFLDRQDGSRLEGYFTPPSSTDFPIVFAIQGSSCESVLPWHTRLSEGVSELGLGMISLEKQGISKNNVDLMVYHQTNSLQQRREDYVLCLENMNLIYPDWEGKAIFWAESEGGMIATHLVGQTPSTAAVLFFGTGGGMKPRDEVKWCLRHRIEQQGALQAEIDAYMTFLETQLDAMILDPTADKQFLGNTYKWWASFIASEEGVASFNEGSVPICLVHGVEDPQIPVQSADLAAEMLSNKETLTYLRLDGYGHDLDTPTVHDIAYRWIEAVLIGEELQNNSNTIQCISRLSTLPKKTQIGCLEYVFARGKERDDNDEKRNEFYGGMQGDKDSNGRENASAGGSYRHDFGNGWDMSVNGGGGVVKDKDGNVKGEVHGRVEVHGRF